MFGYYLCMHIVSIDIEMWMHHTVFQTTLTSTKHVQKKVKEETCILIWNSMSRLSCLLVWSSVFRKLFDPTEPWKTSQGQPLEMCKNAVVWWWLLPTINWWTLYFWTIKPPGGFLWVSPWPDVGGQMPKKNPRKCAHLLGCWKCFCHSTKDVRFEVCGGLFLKRFINKSWNIMKHVFVLWFSFCFQGVWFWARKVGKRSKERYPKVGKKP